MDTKAKRKNLGIKKPLIWFGDIAIIDAMK